MKKEEHYKVYQAWGDMKYKCNNPKAKTFSSFGGKGIKVSTEWLDYETFRADMLPSYLKLVEQGIPSRKIVLGRKNKELDFYKENCEWTTPVKLSAVMDHKHNRVISYGAGINGEDIKKRVFPNLKAMTDFHGYSRTAASNALHKGTNCIGNVKFTKISDEYYERALVDKEFLESLEIVYDEKVFKNNVLRMVREIIRECEEEEDD